MAFLSLFLTVEVYVLKEADPGVQSSVVVVDKDILPASSHQGEFLIPQILVLSRKL